MAATARAAWPSPAGCGCSGKRPLPPAGPCATPRRRWPGCRRARTACVSKCGAAIPTARLGLEPEARYCEPCVQRAARGTRATAGNAWPRLPAAAAKPVRWRAHRVRWRRCPDENSPWRPAFTRPPQRFHPPRAAVSFTRVTYRQEGRCGMTGSDLIVLAPWAVVGAVVGAICARLHVARCRARRRS